MTLKNTYPLLAIFGVINLALLAMIWIDKDTNSWNDVFYGGIVSAWFFYGLPLVVLVGIIYFQLRKKFDTWVSVLMACMFGVPFVSIILVFTYLLIL